MRPPRQHDSEAGYMLLAVVVMVALILIALSVAAPVIARDLRRDKEIESQHRMQQYVRAIQVYQRKFPNQYPASIKVLEGTNNIRYLRKQYIDPLTGKADYKLIHQGEQKTTIKVFFGQELAGMAASLGSAAGMASAGGASPTQTNQACTGTTTALGAGFANSSSGCGTTTSPAGTPGSTNSSGSTGSGSGTGMFGDSSGGVIVGVGTSRAGSSVTEPNAQTTYESWEYWYDPRIEALKKGVSLTGGGVSSQSASSFGKDATNGQSNSGASGATGSTTQPTVTPTPNTP